jgi:hypothetical protein
MDLARREERTIAKILCTLANLEPGENWTHSTFRWSRTTDFIPGWALTEGWLTEEGMTTRGVLCVTYYSGEGKGKRGCRPNVGFRKSLLALVLINEDEIVEEDGKFKPKQNRNLLQGDLQFQKNIGKLPSLGMYFPFFCSFSCSVALVFVRSLGKLSCSSYGRITKWA